MTEEWKNIEKYNGIYQISNLGRVRSVAHINIQKHYIPEKIIKPHPNNSGYLDVSLYIDGKRYHEKIHRLVAEAFIPNPNHLPEVDHIDTDKTNNTVSNLKWCTHSENHLNPLTIELKRKMLTGRTLSEEHKSKLSVKIAVYREGHLLHVFRSYKDLDENSKSIFGIQLWNVYVRKVIRGELDNYHGYTFTEERYHAS